MLHGPPGTGKSSFVQAVAVLLEMNICIMNLSSGTYDDDGLNSAMANTPPNSIILLEDIDAIFIQRESLKAGTEALDSEDEDDNAPQTQ
jgi:chaperone BCS1